MSSVGTGHPDGELRPMPHGSPLEAGVSITATAAGKVESPAAGYWPVAAHRSIVLAVRNTGVNDILVTPRWNFFNGTFPIRVSADAQVVPAGTTKRLLFQNQGDIIDQITFKGVGGDSAMDYYLTGSNLDPLASSHRDMLMMIQRTPAQSIPNNAGTLVEFGPVVGTSFYTSATPDWSFDLTGAGNINGVHILVPGVYLLIAQFAFAAPGNYNKAMQLIAQSSETSPIGNAGGGWTGFDTFDVGGQVVSLFVLSPAAATAGNNSIQVSALQVSGAPVNVDGAALTICRLGSVFP